MAPKDKSVRLLEALVEWQSFLSWLPVRVKVAFFLDYPWLAIAGCVKVKTLCNNYIKVTISGNPFHMLELPAIIDSASSLVRSATGATACAGTICPSGTYGPAGENNRRWDRNTCEEGVDNWLGNNAKVLGKKNRRVKCCSRMAEDHRPSAYGPSKHHRCLHGRTPSDFEIHRYLIALMRRPCSDCLVLDTGASACISCPAGSYSSFPGLWGSFCRQIAPLLWRRMSPSCVLAIATSSNFKLVS